MDDRIVVFISSPTKSLKKERDALREYIPKESYSLYFSEYDREAKLGRNPQEHCRAMILKSKVFVSLVGKEYGSPFPPPASADKSISEWELDTARDAWEKQGVPIEFSVYYENNLTADKIEDERQRAWFVRVNALMAEWCRPYESAGYLVAEVRDLLDSFRDDYLEVLREKQRKIPPWLDKWLFPMAFVSIAVLACSLFFGTTARSHSAISAGSIICVLLCLILIYSQSGHRA